MKYTVQVLVERNEIKWFGVYGAVEVSQEVAQAEYDEFRKKIDNREGMEVLDVRIVEVK